jgi:spore germination cell wall hydrolase CwlJ-like protein
MSRPPTRRGEPDPNVKVVVLTFSRRSLIGLAASLALVSLGACLSTRPEEDGPERTQWLAAEGGGWSDAALHRVLADMNPAAQAMALRFDPARRTRFWGRPVGWAVYDIDAPPALGFRNLSFDEARRLNALIPATPTAGPPARPFVLHASAEDSERAHRCLAQAVYYEAATEPDQGQAAVAQAVLNRLRDPNFPKSVCGVVFQGSQLPTGCQFSFTCDGSLARQPSADGWARAMAVAKRALNGFVEPSVGWATHYHAVYVWPYWAPTLVKLNQVGSQIFYRWSGMAGTPQAFTGRYAGGEANLTAAVLQSVDPRTQLLQPVAGATSGTHTVNLGIAGEVRTYTVADPTAPGGVRARVSGVIAPSRPAPTAAQVDQVNAALSGKPAPPKPVDAMPVTEIGLPQH